MGLTPVSVIGAQAQLLEEPNVVLELDLDNNQITAPGGRALARALRDSPALLSLQLCACAAPRPPRAHAGPPPPAGQRLSRPRGPGS